MKHKRTIQDRLIDWPLGEGNEMVNGFIFIACIFGVIFGVYWLLHWV